VGSGEASKTLASAEQLCQGMADVELDREAVVFALGGGMIGDLAGFVASVYMRGIALVQVPTSLLAQVDASVGGKVAVDLPRAKNLVGAFHQPRAVLIDLSTLDSLPDEQMRAGLGEAIKHAAIADERMFAYLEGNLDSVIKRDRVALKYVLARNCQIKAAVVAADPQEQDWRAVLNFGHTIGHAVERAALDWRLAHGQAVAVGMIGESRVAVERGLAEPEVVERLGRLCRQAGLLDDIGVINPEQAWAAMAADKKIRLGRLRLPVVPRIGQVTLTEEVQLADLRRALESLADGF
jgi:3-dehydroquinate synthase